MKTIQRFSVVILLLFASVLARAQWSWQGVWSGSTAYTANQVVSYLGSSYLCLIGNTNVAPPTSTTDWALIAQAGTNGSAGAAATISVGSTVNGPPLSNASVTNTGNANNAVFNFVIPQSAASGYGVSSINSLTGQFTFTGAGVSCTGTTCTFSGTGSGIGSITWSVPAYMSATPSTISASGTQTFGFNSQTANQVFAGPGSGSAAAPTFRSLVSADIPNNGANTSGNAGTATNVYVAQFTSGTAGAFQLVGTQGSLGTAVALAAGQSGSADLYFTPSTGVLNAPSVISSGFFDSSRGLPVFSGSNPTGYLSYTDPCSELVGISVSDDAANYPGINYADNSLPSTFVHCGPYGFLDPALTPGSGVTQKTSGPLTLSPGVTYGLQSTFTVPTQFWLQGTAPQSGTNGTGTTIRPDTLSFQTNYFGAPGGSPLINLGCPLGSTGCNGLSSQVSHLIINGESIPTLTGLSNFYCQQFCGFDHNLIQNSAHPVVLGTMGTSGGSQTAGPVDFNSVLFADAPAYPVMMGISMTSGGSGYTADFPLIVTGCSVAPTLYAQTSAGAVTGNVYAKGANLGANAWGDCPNGNAVTVSFANGAGTGASGTPIIETLTTNAGYFSGSGSGTKEMRGNSANAGALGIVPPYGYDLESSGGMDFSNNYSESSQVGFCIGCTATAGSVGFHVSNFTGESANNGGFAAAILGNAGKVGVTMDNVEMSGAPWLLRDQGVNGGNIPAMEAINGAGNQGWLQFYARSPDNHVISMDPHIITNIPIGSSAPNCGSSCGSGGAPAIGYPVKLVGGDLQAMASGDTVDAVGIASNGLFGTSYNTNHGGTYCFVGQCAGYIDNTPTPGDWVVLGGETPAMLHDTGSNTDPSGEQAFGTVADPIVGALQAAPATPNVSGVTFTVTGGSTITDTYEAVAVSDLGWDLTHSAASSAITVTTAPQALSGGNKISFASLPTTNNLAIYRTSIGSTFTSTGTVYCGPDGTATGVSAMTGSSGITFPLNAAFSGGGFSTEPSGTVQVVGGAWTGVNFSNRGAGCTSNGTVTYTANSCATGFIGYSNRASTFVDNGRCGDGTIAPVASAVGVVVNMALQHFYGPFTSAGLAQNMAPDTAFKQGAGAYWTLPGGTAIVAGGDTNPNSSGNGLVYTGTGSPSGALRAYALTGTLVAGQLYSFSAWMDTTNITAGEMDVYICSNPSCSFTPYAHIGPQTIAVAKTDSITFTAPTSGTAYYVFEWNLTGASGQPVSFAEPMLAKTTGNILSYVENDGPGSGDSTSGYRTAIPVQAPAIIVTGTQTISGCSLTSAVGGETAGSFHSGTTGTCTVTITPGFTAPNGFRCSATDLTTSADTIQQTTTSATACTIAGTTASADVITWQAIAF